jgi:hypothetical protein
MSLILHLLYPYRVQLLLPFVITFVFVNSRVANGQDALCVNCPAASPVAVSGGPYAGPSGQAIAFDGGGSWSYDGSIIYYYWDFGDGTAANGPTPSHNYSADGVYSVCLTVCDETWNCAATQSFVTIESVNFPVRINFEDLLNNTVIADHYLSQYGVSFSSANFFYPTHVYQNCGFCDTTSPPNFLSTKPDDSGQVIVTFQQPASNLIFYAIGVDTLSGTFAVVDLYRNGSATPSNTFAMNGNFTSTVGFSSGSLNNIDRVVIRGITDPAGIGFDDFSFTVPADVKITSGRVNGYLNGTTQNALLGADVALNANPLPGAFGGGTYSWTCTPSPCSILTPNNSSSVTLRTNELSTIVGNYTVTVNYVKNGIRTSGSMTINSILPTLTRFTGSQGPDLITLPNLCASPEFEPPWWFYRLGCGSSSPAMNFTAQVHAPAFISEPSQSGIKYVQAISGFHKYTQRGLRCITRRTSELDVDSGWQLDKQDPANLPGYPIHRFNEGNDLTELMVDAPQQPLTGISSWEFLDYLSVDDQFSMYLVYFTGSNPAIPEIQRPIGRLRWSWGGLVDFEWIDSLNQGIFNLRRTNSGFTAGVATNDPMVTMNGNFQPIVEVPCPGGPSLTNNKIDSARFFVRRHYSDFFNREPDDSGWDFWTSEISQCGFDLGCIHAQRINVGLAFFYSSEFILTDPDMANPPGTPDFNPAIYNREFVYWCYQKYLGRDPHDDPVGWQFWTDNLNSNGDYAHTIDSFQLSDEYRNRLGNN